MLCAGRGAKRNRKFRMGPLGGRAIRPAACGAALCSTLLGAATAAVSVNCRRSHRRRRRRRRCRHRRRCRRRRPAAVTAPS